MQLICTASCSTCRKAVALLKERGIAFDYRDYKKEPLTQVELRRLLKALGVHARELLRPRDPAYATLGLSGTESDAKLVPLIAEYPGLLQRPIGIRGSRAVVGRPIENLLELA